MKIFTHIALFLVFFILNFSYSQEELRLTSKDSSVISSSMIGLGYNFVDDSGDVFDDLFAIGSQWNFVPYPSRVSIGRYTKSGLGFEAIATYNKYLVGNIIDGTVNTEEKNYLALDARVSYDLNKLVGQTAWFDPYVGAGIGYTHANNRSRGTYNAVVGFRVWISERWGLDFNSSGKWAVGNNGATNHIQHAAGVVYQFNIEKGLTKKGEEKLALIQEMEKKKQRTADSIATVERLEEEAFLAERLAREREKARLAAAEKAKVDAENERRQNIENEINAIGYAHFDLNSSFLGDGAKKVLDELMILLKNNPKVELRVSAHTDSRGTDMYNLWLSERRVKRTIDYLVSRGIAPERLNGSAHGEEHLANHCDDNVYCTEAEHRENRRSEFTVVKF